jgi:UDP-N-acetylmuramoyl-tripeptide--D-alanyl-D-alanine ligase
MKTESLYSLFLEYPQVTTDTRQIVPNSLYFALKGEHFDGNAFAQQALDLGAARAIIDNPQFLVDERCILVDNVLESLQDLARHHRRQFTIPIIGLTGSNGKTTTKELLNAVLSQKYGVLATKGNLNNHIGVPLTLLQLRKETEIAIIEMGANHPGEIELLCSIAEPTHGLITNVGKAHLEGFGSFEGVKKTKGELYDFLAGHGGTLFLQASNSHLREMAAARFKDLEATAVFYGPGEENQVSGKVLTVNPYLELEWTAAGQHYVIHTQITGHYNLENVLAAVAVGKHFGVSDERINAGIAGYMPKNNRSQLVKTEKGNTVVGDFYNANASSMQVALENFKQMDLNLPKVLILGDMFELGEAAGEEHLNVYKQASALGVNRMLFIGANFYDLLSQFMPDSTAAFFPNIAAAREALESNSVKNSLILLKGSRGIALEKLMDLL